MRKSFKSKMILVCGFGFLCAACLFAYSGIQRASDERDAREKAAQVNPVIAPRIEAHRKDLETKKAGLWQADPGKAMLANRD